MMGPRRVFGLGLALSLLVACRLSPQRGLSPPVTELPPEAMPTPIACTADPAGLTIRILIVGPGHVRVEAEGLLPNEPVFVRIHGVTESSSGARDEHTQESQTVTNEIGALSAALQVEPSAGASMWDVAVVHSRGVACASATSP